MWKTGQISLRKSSQAWSSEAMRKIDSDVQEDETVKDD